MQCLIVNTIGDNNVFNGMIMTGINDDAIIRAIFQIRSEFTCDIGNKPISITGTGFFIRNDIETFLFITNRHNLDPTLKLGVDTTYKLSRISFCLRKQLDGMFSSETKWISLKRCDCIKNSMSADISAIYNFELAESGNINEYQPSPFLFSELADKDYITRNVSMMDVASFVGFPGMKVGWWDQEGNLPIARTVNIASYPKKSFSNPSIKTSDVILVSGLSFSGSSGSPILLHQKGIVINGSHNIEIKNDSYVPPKIIGIMSGHWWDENCEPVMFRHSGLSYFTKSSAIHDLICAL